MCNALVKKQSFDSSVRINKCKQHARINNSRQTAVLFSAVSTYAVRHAERDIKQRLVPVKETLMQIKKLLMQVNEAKSYLDSLSADRTRAVMLRRSNRF